METQKRSLISPPFSLRPGAIFLEIARVEQFNWTRKQEKKIKRVYVSRIIR